MIVLMTHPNHGLMHAYDHSEVERLQKLGWSEKKPNTPASVPAVNAIPPVTLADEPQRKKLGRPFKAK